MFGKENTGSRIYTFWNEVTTILTRFEILILNKLKFQFYNDILKADFVSEAEQVYSHTRSLTIYKNMAVKSFLKILI